MDPGKDERERLERMLRRWEPGKGGTRVELGVVVFGKRVRTRLRGRRESEERGESGRGKIRQMVVTALGRGSVLCPPSKREDDSLVVRRVTRSHTNNRHVHCACPCVHPTMFSGLPSKLSAPFGILGDEPKLAFRSQPGGIAKLASIRARNLDSVPFPS